ncbi:beta-secretase 1-like [Xenia sp. Carnegie-2017]|uniref:beta-secretase 1-like n=1 Tax=Xenia sp. Carnegie-2017 TaxID=2897299 RepID=UPI001F0435F1|nr:beta-secretase 1-like [Xenia sp. Carnegie-2017]
MMNVNLSIVRAVDCITVLIFLFEGFYAFNDKRQVITIPLRKKRESRVNIQKQRRELTDSLSPEYHDNLSGRPGQGYYLAIDLGTPPQTLNVLVDTGSSNFAVGSSKHDFLPVFFDRKKSVTYLSMERDVSVMYTQGNWEGRLGSDMLRFIDGPNATVRVEVASILSSQQFFINGSFWEGILGLGYPRLSKPDPSVIPVFDKFVQDGIVKDSFSMQLCGSSELDPIIDPTVAGTMVFGGIDSSLYDGEMLYTPIVKKWYYEVVITDIAVNSIKESLGLDCKKYNYDKTIVDSGTTHLRISAPVYDGILSKIKKYDKLHVPDDFWNGKQMMCWTDDRTPWNKFPDIYISLLSSTSSSKHFTLKIPPQLYLRETIERLFESQRCYKFAITRADRGTVIGAVIMEGFYVVFDREKSQVGFGATTCGADGRPNPQSKVLGPYTRDPVDCQYIESENSDTTLLTVAYVMAGVCVLCLIPITVLLIQASVRRRNNASREENKAVFPETRLTSPLVAEVNRYDKPSKIGR